MNNAIVIDNFLSEDECKLLYDFVIEQYDLQTNLYSESIGVPWPLLHSLFKIEKIKEIFLPKFKKLLTKDTLANFGMRGRDLKMSSWANLLIGEEQLMAHRHADEKESIISTNVFIGGPTDIGTTYFEYGEYDNHIGKAVMFDGNIPHVVNNRGLIKEPRVTMVFDFTEDTSNVAQIHPSVGCYGHEWYNFLGE